MADAWRTTKRETPDRKVPKWIEEMEQAMYGDRVGIAHDGWTAGSPTFSVTVCSASPGVPVTMTMRVVAPTVAAARARAKELMDELCDGTELLNNASFTRSGESCRVYPDSSLIRGRLTCAKDDPAGPRSSGPARPSPLEMQAESLVRCGALDAERAAAVSCITTGIVGHANWIDRADRHIGDRTTFNIEVCSMDRGVPVGVNVRVVAADDVEAIVRAKQLLGRLSQGTELLDGADYARPGESCRVYTNPAYMPTRVPIVDEDGGGEWYMVAGV